MPVDTFTEIIAFFKNPFAVSIGKMSIRCIRQIAHVHSVASLVGDN